MSEKELEFSDLPTLLAILTTLCTIAVIMNIVVIVVFCLRRKMSIDAFIVNMAIADVLLAGIALPLRFFDVIKSAADFNQANFVCKVVMFIPKFSVVLSISTMVALAIDRYRAIVTVKQMSIRDALIVVGVNWMIAISVSAPQLYEYSVYEKYDDYSNSTAISCGSEGVPEHFETIYAIIVLICSYCVPVAIVVVCYTSTMVYIWKSSKQFNANKLNNSGQVMKKRMRVLKMLITITVVFAMLWCPYFVLFTIEEIMDLDHTSESAEWPHITKQIMIVMSTMSNPVLYTIFDKWFRLKILKIFTCGYCKSSTISPTSEA